MATPRNVKNILQTEAPNDIIIRVGDTLFYYDNAKSDYVMLVSGTSTLETNALLKELTVRAGTIIQHLEFITENNFGEI